MVRPQVAALLLLAGLAGCRHRVVPVKFPQISHTPAVLAPAPPLPATIASLPSIELELASVPLPAPPRRRPSPPSREESQAPPQPTETPAPEFALGTLSPGDETDPESQQQAQDMIAAIFKRIQALPARTAESKRRQVRQVRNFLNQAQQALSSGDAQGAKILATKAGLLMDDLEKK